MMKMYVTPQMKISMFDIETVSAAEEELDSVLSQPVYGNNLNSYIQNKQNVQRNLDFSKAIEFK